MYNYIKKIFEDKTIDTRRNIKELKGIGSYVCERLQYSLNVKRNLTIDKFLKKFEGKTSKEITETLKLSLQNKRSNQCVDVKYNSLSYKKYHTRDINKNSYDVCIALLNYSKRNLGYNLIFGRLVYTKKQTLDTKVCGCLTKSRCSKSNICEYKDKNCIPINKNTIGFEGSGRPGQKESFINESQRNEILNKSKIVKNAKFYIDPDTTTDNLMKYYNPRFSKDNQNLWRRAGKTLRSPR